MQPKSANQKARSLTLKSANRTAPLGSVMLRRQLNIKASSESLLFCCRCCCCCELLLVEEGALERCVSRRSERKPEPKRPRRETGKQTDGRTDRQTGRGSRSLGSAVLWLLVLFACGSSFRLVSCWLWRCFSRSLSSLVLPSIQSQQLAVSLTLSSISCV